jgi:hypothetical protein
VVNGCKSQFELHVLLVDPDAPQRSEICGAIDSWSGFGPTGYLALRRAPSAIDLAACDMMSARPKIQGPSLNERRASISSALAASRSVFDVIFRTFAASESLSQGSTPSRRRL